MDIFTWANQNMSSLLTILFYLGIFALVYFNRKRFEVQSGFIFMLRTKFGLKAIDRFSKKHRELVKLIGYIGIGVGFTGMIFISYTLIKNLYDLLFVAGAQSAVAPALPGVSVPGSPIFIPLIAGWIALFIVTFVHEFSHGIVASAHGLKIKSTGVVFFGPIMGAFVEPDEKKMEDKQDVAKYSVFAAGPFSNILLTIVAILAMLLLAAPALNAMTYSAGLSFGGVTEGYPAAEAGIKPGMVFTSLNGASVNNATSLTEIMDSSAPGQVIELGTNESVYTITLASYPIQNKTTLLDKVGNIFRRLWGKEIRQEQAQSQKGYLGVSGINTEYRLKNDNWFTKLGYSLLLKVEEFLFLILLLSSGIGLVNLLPLGPIDGGRMLQVSLTNINGKKKGTNLWKSVSAFFLIVLLLNVVLGLLNSLI